VPPVIVPDTFVAPVDDWLNVNEVTVNALFDAKSKKVPVAVTPVGGTLACTGCVKT
jgi:hypothetical protein